MSRSHPICLGSDHPRNAALSWHCRAHVWVAVPVWCPWGQGRWWGSLMQRGCARGPGRIEGLHLLMHGGRWRALLWCKLVEMSEAWRGSCSCCLQDLLAFLERRKPNSPERCTVQGQEAAITSFKKGNARVAWGKTRGRPGRAAQGIVTSFLSCVNA